MRKSLRRCIRMRHSIARTGQGTVLVANRKNHMQSVVGFRLHFRSPARVNYASMKPAGRIKLFRCDYGRVAAPSSRVVRWFVYSFLSLHVQPPPPFRSSRKSNARKSIALQHQLILDQTVVSGRINILTFHVVKILAPAGSTNGRNCRQAKPVFSEQHQDLPARQDRPFSSEPNLAPKRLTGHPATVSRPRTQARRCAASNPNTRQSRPSAVGSTRGRTNSRRLLHAFRNSAIPVCPAW